MTRASRGSNIAHMNPPGGPFHKLRSGHYRVFRDIGRIFHVSSQQSRRPWSAAEREGFTESGCVEDQTRLSIVFRRNSPRWTSCGSHSPNENPAEGVRAGGLGNPLLVGCCSNAREGSVWTKGGGRQAVHQPLPPPALPAVAVPTLHLANHGQGDNKPCGIGSTGMGMVVLAPQGQQPKGPTGRIPKRTS